MDSASPEITLAWPRDTTGLVSHTPKALAPGDRVQSSRGRPAKIIAIHGDQAWIKYDDNDLYDQFRLTILVRLP